MRSSINLTRLGAVKPFEQIPGPKPLPIIGNVWRYLPVIGDYDILKPVENGRKNLTRYGPIVRENLYGNTYLVHLFDPKDIETMFRNEGKYPERRSHRALKKLRMDKPSIFSSGGIFPENGPEWHRIRRGIQGVLMNPKSANRFVEDCDQVSRSLVNYITTNRGVDNEVDDFFHILHFWALENIIKVTLNVKLGSLDQPISSLSDLKFFIKRSHEAEDAIMKMEIGSLDLWKYFKTPIYKKLSSAIDDMCAFTFNWLKIGKELLNQGSSDSQSNHSVLHHLVSKENWSDKDINGIVLDLIFAGLDTTAFVTGFGLLDLAKHHGAQEKVHQEVLSLLPEKDSPITPKTLESMKYLKACVKESMRLRPLSVGTGRLTTEAIIIRDYCIPAGTMIIAQNQIASLQESNFDQPESYMPERWLQSSLRTESNGCSVNRQFAFLPFGFGTRMCVGRRISEIEIYSSLARIIRKFRVEHQGPEVGLKYCLINHPDKPMKLKFIERN